MCTHVWFLIWSYQPQHILSWLVRLLSLDFFLEVNFNAAWITIKSVADLVAASVQLNSAFLMLQLPTFAGSKLLFKRFELDNWLQSIVCFLFIQTHACLVYMNGHVTYVFRFLSMDTVSETKQRHSYGLTLFLFQNMACSLYLAVVKMIMLPIKILPHHCWILISDCIKYVDWFI